MLRNLIFQTHWLLGITAGLVLALVGVTGALLSYEQPLLRALNPGVLTVPAAGRTPLAPDVLLGRVREQAGNAPQAITLYAEPDRTARVVLPPADGAVPAPGGRVRGETRHLDPYTGALLARPRGEGFFRTTMQLHRWLAAGDVGKHIVGASTVALVFFCVSGLYLRWPRRWTSLRAWLHLDGSLTGRRFLWHLHSVVATWLLVPYLVMALSGLYWSYGWYREGLMALSGTPAGGQRGPTAIAAGDGAAPDVDLAAAFAAFHRAVPDWSTVTLRLPGAAGAALEWSYQDPDPPHERANNRLLLDAGTLAVTAHERYRDKPLGQRLMAGLFPIHSGSWFGGVGLFVFCAASLAMPLFTITGLQLYLDRRAKKRAGLARRRERARRASAR